MTVTCQFSELERQVFEEMRLAGRYASDQDVLRGALWNHARHLDIDVPIEAFAIGAQQPSLFDGTVSA